MHDIILWTLFMYKVASIMAVWSPWQWNQKNIGPQSLAEGKRPIIGQAQDFLTGQVGGKSLWELARTHWWSMTLCSGRRSMGLWRSSLEIKSRAPSETTLGNFKSTCKWKIWFMHLSAKGNAGILKVLANSQTARYSQVWYSFPDTWDVMSSLKKRCKMCHFKNL